MSSSAPAPVRPFTPRDSMPMWVANAAPTMHPAVLAPYTLPMDASPSPREVSAWVASGSVIPAQNAVGNITSIEAARPASVLRT